MKKYFFMLATFALLLTTLNGTTTALAGPPGPPPNVSSEQKGITHVSEGDSIQDAIDAAADGDIIHVEEGIYEGRLHINGKDLKLVAMGDVTIMEPDPDQTQWPDAISTVRIENSQSSMVGFTIDVKGGWSGIYAIGGPYYKNGEVKVTIKNNLVKNYNKNGITVNGKKAYGKILNNTVVGEIGPGWANNGIQIGFGATGFIKGNTVKNNIWIGEGWTATAILLYDTTGVQVVGNEIYKGQMGIGVLGNNNKVVKNTLDTGTWAIAIYDGVNNKVIGNRITDYDYEVLDYGQKSKVHANFAPVK